MRPQSVSGIRVADCQHPGQATVDIPKTTFGLDKVIPIPDRGLDEQLMFGEAFEVALNGTASEAEDSETVLCLSLVEGRALALKDPNR
jgi:hypothetical protein